MSYDNTIAPKKTAGKAAATTKGKAPAATTGGYRDRFEPDYADGFPQDIDYDDDTDPRVSYASGAAAPAMTGANAAPATSGGKQQKGQLDMLATAHSSDIVLITGVTPVGYKIIAHGDYRSAKANPVEQFKPRVGDYFKISDKGVWESLTKQVAEEMAATIAKSRNGVAVINNTTSGGATPATGAAAAAATGSAATTKAAAPTATGAAAPKATGGPGANLITACARCGTAKKHGGHCSMCELYDAKHGTNAAAPKATGAARLTTACKHCGTMKSYGSRCAACDNGGGEYTSAAAAPSATGHHRRPQGMTEQDYVNKWAERQRTSRFLDDD